MTQLNVGVIIGSIAGPSINRRLANALIKLAPPEMKMTEIPIKHLTFYNYEYDKNYPEDWTNFKDAILKSDGVLIVTPEYNRSIPGVLKNAIDIASRPWGTNAFNEKPVALFGVSTGAIGTALAQSHLRQVMGFSNARILGQPEGYISNFKPELVDEEFNITVESTRNFLASYLANFQKHIEMFAGK